MSDPNGQSNTPMNPWGTQQPGEPPQTLDPSQAGGQVPSQLYPTGPYGQPVEQPSNPVTQPASSQSGMPGAPEAPGTPEMPVQPGSGAAFFSQPIPPAQPVYPGGQP